MTLTRIIVVAVAVVMALAGGTLIAMVIASIG